MRRLTLVLLVFGFCQLLLGQTYQETFEHARSLLKQNQFAEALEQARLAVKLDSTRWEGWYVAGTAAVGLEKTDLAIDYFQEALSRAPDAAKPTVNNAITACRQVLASKPAARGTPIPPTPGQDPSQAERLPAPPNAESDAQFAVIHFHGGFGPTCKGILHIDASGIRYACTRGQVSIDKNDVRKVEIHRKFAMVKVSAATGSYSFGLVSPEELGSVHSMTFTGGDARYSEAFVEAAQRLLGIAVQVEK
jgi:tetratricopeptide (TPR) repeat protein